MKDAVNIDGVELMGYTSWGCIDLVSVSTGEMKNPKIELCAFIEGKWMRIEAVAVRKLGGR